MSSIAPAAHPGADENMASVRVWDPLVRIFHWSLVATFAVAFVTAEELDTIHEWAGYVAAALVAVRVLWGFIGTKYARFSSFLRGPSATLSYLGDVAQGRERRFVGHNPLGAAMIVALLACIVLLAMTGYWMTGPGATEEGIVEELHEVVGNGMLVLIAAHVAGVIYSGLRHRENLVAAMFTGRKRAQ